MYKYVCQQCGKEFENRKQNRKFCSYSCYQEWLKTHKPQIKKEKKLVEVICKNCGKHEMVFPCRAKNYVCCSVECLKQYKSKVLGQKEKVICPVCSKEFYVKHSQKSRRKCCSVECAMKYRDYNGKKNPNSLIKKINEGKIKTDDANRKKDFYRALVKNYFKVSELPKNYHIHHKDANPLNNSLENLVLLPKDTHMLIHRYFGNLLINAIHTKKISRDIFYTICNNESKTFYEPIENLNITKQTLTDSNDKIEMSENPYVYVKTN